MERSDENTYCIGGDVGVSHTSAAHIDQLDISASSVPHPTSAWEDAKQAGSAHYKTGSVEPIDLYKAGGYFEHFAICNIIKYAFRLGKRRARDKVSDVNKIIHYATLLKASIEGRE